MDDEQLAKLVARVEQAFPGDLVAQRQAWEFIESVSAARDEAVAPDLATGSTAADAADEPARWLLEAGRALLHEAGGRLASAVQVLLPPPPGLATLARAEPAPTIEVEPDVAAGAGLQGPVSVEHGDGFLTLVVRVAEDADPSHLGAIVSLPDETVAVQRFERLDPTLASAHFDLPESTPAPLSIVLAHFPPA
jgi:hypothetical protein